jgi:hypothetical protein
MAQSNNEGSTSSGEVEAPVILGMRGSPAQAAWKHLTEEFRWAGQ